VTGREERACSGPPESGSEQYPAESEKARRRGLGVRVEFAALRGGEGDELEARQNAAILEILRWTQRWDP
jgi:hypothetical protein